MWRTMFSIMTMASSTRNPVAMVSAIRDRLSKLNPARYMKPTVPMRDNPLATLAITVAPTPPRRRKLGIGGDHDCLMRPVEAALRLIDIGARQARADVFQA